MTEFPPDYPEQNEPQNPFSGPETEATFAYVELDELLAEWMKFHPDVEEQDVDDALERFREAIRKRDEKRDEIRNKGKEPPAE